MAPVEAEYVPEGHATQLVAPRPCEKVPAPQLAQPGAPAPEYRPIPQFTQAADAGAPTKGENVPAAHGVQLGAMVEAE